MMAANTTCAQHYEYTMQYLYLYTVPSTSAKMSCEYQYVTVSIMSSVYLLKGFITQCIPAELAWSGVTDGLEWTQCCLLSSPSACVSPSDPTLTVENVREVMAKVGNWWGVWRWLDVPDSKIQEIDQQSSTEREKSLALGEYWVNTAPGASWESLARVLYQWREERALAMMKQYLQQGMCSSWLAEVSVHINSLGCIIGWFWCN